MRTTEINKLAATIHSLGGPKGGAALRPPRRQRRVRQHRRLVYAPQHRRLGHRPAYELRQKYPIVLLTPFPNGWQVKPIRTPANLASTCGKLNALYVPTGPHPQGVLIHK